MENWPMIKAEIEPGKEYAFREKRSPGVPLQLVETIEERIRRFPGTEAKEQGR